MPDTLPGKGLMGWLGRQFGYIRSAVRADATKQVIYRKDDVQETPLPDQPNVKLRRTTIDEVIVDRRPEAMGRSDKPPGV